MASKQDDDMSGVSESEKFASFSSDDDKMEDGSDAELMDKDSDEEELERLVLGSKDAFRQNLFKNDDANATTTAADDDEEDGNDGFFGLEMVNDADLFMLDTAPTPLAGQLAKQNAKEQSGLAAVWEDSDDERLTISLADASRLRKLRQTEADDLVSGTEYVRRLRQQYLRLHPMPSWATAREEEERPSKRRRKSSAADSSDESDSDSDDVNAQPLEAFLRDVRQLAGLGSSKKRALRPEVIDIQRTREIPDKHKAPVECLSFHPEYPVLLSASSASVLYLHHIAPEAHPTPNPQLTSVQIKQVDVRRAEFLYPEGDKIFFAGRRRYFHQWDLLSGLIQKTTQIMGHKLEHRSMERFKLSPCGRYMGIVASTKKGGGIINVVNTTTTQWVAAARLSSNNGIADFAWWSTGEGMTILGKNGHVGEYSMESRSFVGTWIDEGCIGGIVLSLGGRHGPHGLGEDRWVAVGSNSGITNIYDRNELIEPKASDLTIKERPKPRRTFEQLVTPITVISFSPDGQVMAFGSKDKKDALRLVHLPSCTVYRNWPTEQTPLGRITSVAFGRQSDLLAVGNDMGKIRLWQIRN